MLKAALALLMGREEVAVATLPQVLTDREEEVFGLLAKGLTNRQIAMRLGIALNTAKNQVASIYAKLGVRCRAEAAARYTQEYAEQEMLG